MATQPTPSAEFRQNCVAKDVDDGDVDGLWRLFTTWRWRAADPAARLDELFEDYRHWRQFDRSRAGDPAAARDFERYWSAYIKGQLAWRARPEEREEYQAIFFERIYRLIGPRHHWRSPFVVYLRTILVNITRTHGARATRRRQRERSLEGEMAGRSLDPPAVLPNPEQVSLNLELRRALRRALEQLPPLDRYILVQSLIEGVTGNELASILGLSRDAVHKRSQRARRKLQAVLRADGLAVRTSGGGGLP